MVACGQAPTVQTSSEYEVMRITTSDKELQTTYSASIRGRQDIDIYPQVSGFLTKLCVEEGQAVRKGIVSSIIDQVKSLPCGFGQTAGSQCGSGACKCSYGSTDV